jgi:methyl-accepting chemotaxis protein
MQLKYKIPLILFVVFLVLVGTFVTSVLLNSSKVRKESQLESARAMAQDHSNNVNAFMLDRIAELKGLESNIYVMRNLSAEIRAKSTKALLEELMSHPIVSRVYIDEAKRVSKPFLTEPYKLKIPGETAERRVISLHVGAAVMDLDVDILQKEVFDKMRDSKMGSYVIFVSNSGTRVAHPKQELVMVPTGNDLSAQQQSDLHKAVRNGEYHVVTKKSLLTGEVSVLSYVPMHPKELESPWSVAYVVSLAALRGDELKMRYTVMGIFGLATTLWFLFLLWLMSSVFRRLIRTIKLLKKMTEGEGDLTMRFRESGNDEIGQMSSGLNHLIEKLHSTIKTVQTGAKNLLDASSVLYEFSNQLFKISGNSLEQSASISESVVGAGESSKAIADDASRTSASANELAGTAEQMSMNMNSVAGAVEELSTSFALITNSADESRKIASEASQQSVNATEVMNKLGIAASEIGQVTDVIKKIADKTNLLALNATIEAASAGAAGRGFAVVAGEIKELANQSAKSADDIASRIEGIQSGTGNAVEVINSVAEIISKINISIDAIASSVGEQTKASNEIANNAEQASSGAKRLVEAISEVAQTAKTSAQNAGDVATGVRNISNGMSLLHEDAKKSNENSIELKETAKNLRSMAEHLDSVVCMYRT